MSERAAPLPFAAHLLCARFRSLVVVGADRPCLCGCVCVCVCVSVQAASSHFASLPTGTAGRTTINIHTHILMFVVRVRVCVHWGIWGSFDINKILNNTKRDNRKLKGFIDQC